jgi:hypothetical protein
MLAERKLTPLLYMGPFTYSAVNALKIQSYICQGRPMAEAEWATVGPQKIRARIPFSFLSAHICYNLVNYRMSKIHVVIG